MTPLAWAFAGLAAVAAVIDWRATARGAVAARHRTKPAPMVLLIAAAASVQPWHGWTQMLILAAFAASLAGDLLLLPGRPLAPGLAAFLVAHVAFILAFSGRAETVAGSLFGAAFLVVLLPLTVPSLMRGVRATEPRMIAPVAVYMAALCALVIAAGTTGSPWPLLGAIVFLVSDLMIGWREFVGPIRAEWHIMATYHAAQFAFLAWLAGLAG